jgi:putative membrane protein
LATVKFILASGSLMVPMINEDLACELINEGLYQVESSQKSWM